MMDSAELDIPATELTVLDTALRLSNDGKQARIMLSTDKGPVTLDLHREVLERLVFRSVSELADTIASVRAKSGG
ncbi:hypothetical protein SAMN05519103_05249 [Rhizobiales bacterium GAS113]|nr:hypothetical protein SAMN05519103_05249 [Rhizobiales bacterium GAS113]